jgi:hypothetical protein
MLDRHECGEGGDFHYVDVHGVDRVVAVPPRGLAFTLCQVPVVYAPADAATIALVRADGSVEAHAGTEVPRAACREVFLRSGAVAAIRVGVTGLAKEGNHDERR